MWQMFELTLWGPDKIAAISQTTFSNAFSWMKMYEFRLRFHYTLFLRFQLTIFQHWCRWWLGADKATNHYLNQWWLVYRHIYASLGLNELRSLKHRQTQTDQNSLFIDILSRVWVWVLNNNSNNVDGLMRKRRNSIAKALELHVSCTNSSMW